MFFCGIDIGTTNSKGVMLDEDMQLLDRVSIPYNLSGNRNRLSAKIWYEHFCKILESFSMKGLLGSDEKLAPEFLP